MNSSESSGLSRLGRVLSRSMKSLIGAEKEEALRSALRRLCNRVSSLEALHGTTPLRQHSPRRRQIRRALPSYGTHRTIRRHDSDSFWRNTHRVVRRFCPLRSPPQSEENVLEDACKLLESSCSRQRRARQADEEVASFGCGSSIA